MKKAGTTQKPTRNELKPPALLAFAQLLFAALLLYVIRNPLPFEQTLASTIDLPTGKPAIVINIPLDTVAVAAPTPPAREVQM